MRAIRRRRLGRLAALTLGAFGAGAALTYFFDTRSGGRRRAHVRDRLVHLRGVAKQQLLYRAHDLENRAHGAVAEVRRRLREQKTDEDVLIERVRAKLGHVCSHPFAIEVHSKGKGVIELKGPIMATEHDRVVHAVRAIPGVHGIDDDLELRQALAGWWPRHGPRTLLS